MRNEKLQKMVYAALIAAAYTALGMALAPISFGQMQVRVAEALTILPVFSAVGVWGVTLGCLLTNAIGVLTGANILGLLDVLTGTLATLLSALLTRTLRQRLIKGMPLLATLPPVLINAVVVGGELCYITTGSLWHPLFWGFAGSVALGQLGACTVLGLLLYSGLAKTGMGEKLRRL